jgi:dynein heavy chain
LFTHGFSYICWARYISNPDFEPTKIVTVSKAAFGLCSWIGAVEAYDRAAKIVAPKIAALKAAEAEYNEVMGQLAVKQAALQVVSKCLLFL